MKSFFKNFSKTYTWVAIVYIALGILLLIFQDIVPRIIIYGFGAMLVILGLINIIENFMNDNSNGFSDFSMVSGIINIGIGLFFIFNADIVEQSIAFVVGMLFILDSFIKFRKATDLLTVKYPYWWLTLIFAILTILLGVIIVVMSFNSEDARIFMGTIAVLTGISLIIVGITDIWVVSRVNKYINNK